MLSNRGHSRDQSVEMLLSPINELRSILPFSFFFLKKTDIVDNTKDVLKKQRSEIIVHQSSARIWLSSDFGSLADYLIMAIK